MRQPNLVISAETEDRTNSVETEDRIFSLLI